jgi:hypothetical protein
MGKGTNKYEFRVTSTDGSKKTYRKQLKVDFEEIIIGDIILYLDPYFALDGQNIVWQEDDFDGIPTSFLTAWCADQKNDIVLQYDYVYSLIPSCLSYSTRKQYLLYYTEPRESDGKIYYTMKSPVEGVLYESFPLFQSKWGVLYQSLAFYNPWGQFLQILSAYGDVSFFETLVQHFDVRAGRNTMSLREVNKDQIEIENGYEKLILYYYKDNESKRNINHPWLRYKYYDLRSGSRRLIRQGNVYIPEKSLRLQPETDEWPVYTLDARLYDDKIVVQDSFKTMSYAIWSLWAPVSIQDVQQPPFSCKAASVGVYGYLWDLKRYVYQHDGFHILGRGWNTARVQIEDSQGSTYPVDQHYLGAVATYIGPKMRWTLLWWAWFYIVGYDARDKEVCRKSFEVDIIQ